MNRLRSQDGFSLTELLVAMVIGMATLLAAFALIDTSTTRSMQVTGRTDASQRGRLALDAMTRALRSQVCVDGAVPIVSGDANQVTFTSDLSANGSSDRRTITFDAATRRLTQTVVQGVGNEPNRTFTGASTTTVLLADVAAEPAKPVFTYWADQPGFGGSQFQQLTTSPLPATDLKRVARIDISFVARPSNAATSNTWSSTLEDSIVVRAIDNYNANPTVSCS